MPEDKFGRPIYPHVFSKLKKNEAHLLESGYRESKNKPNLFYKRVPQGWLYSDMRGTEEVPIWEDTSPLFFWRFDDGVPVWLRRRLIKQELKALGIKGCPCRLSFYLYRSPDFEGIDVFLDEEAGIYEWDDGYCRFCGKDFGGSGSFCSAECESRFRDSMKEHCKVCGEKIELFREVRHHISYFPEKVIFVHASCHNRIHKTSQFPGLKPSDDEIERFYGNDITRTGGRDRT